MPAGACHDCSKGLSITYFCVFLINDSSVELGKSHQKVYSDVSIMTSTQYKLPIENPLAIIAKDGKDNCLNFRRKLFLLH